MGIVSRIKRRLSILGGDPPRPTAAAPRPMAPPPPPAPRRTAEEVRAAVERDIADHKIVLFMKGTPTEPQCGFSARAAGILDTLGVPYETRDVLADPDLRQAVKDVSEWPTLPQIFIGGEFVGGSDILQELHDSGELKTLVAG